MPGHLVLLTTSHRVAPGLLSAAAWAALRAADRVLVGDPDHPLLASLGEAGLPVAVVVAAAPEPEARELLAMAVEADVVRVLASDGEPELVTALELVRGGGSDVELSVMAASWDLPGAHLLDLVAVMDRLRSPGGCPWDAQQTHESLVEYLVEEAYETVEAIETGRDDDLREELGDVLLQVVFHARIAQERHPAWSVDDVADGIVGKLVARHPHVFADVDAATAADVERNWAALKAAEKGRESVIDGVPLALPALVLASKLLSRARSVEALGAAPVAVAAADAALAAVDGELGELLFALVARSRDDGVDAEAALRDAARRFRGRVRAAEGVDPGRPAEDRVDGAGSGGGSVTR